MLFQIAIDAWSGVAKITFPTRICTPVLEKAAFLMHNRSQRTKEGIKAAFQAEIRTPVSEKTGKTNTNRSYS